MAYADDCLQKIKGESSKKNELETSDQTNIEENRKPSSIGPFHKTKPIDLKGILNDLNRVNNLNTDLIFRKQYKGC